MIDAITSRLTNLNDATGKPLFIEVLSAADVVTAMEKPLNASPVAFVVPLEEVPGANQRDMGLALQTIKENIGIIIGLRTVGVNQNTNIELTNIRTILRNSLFGWAPTLEHKGFLLGSSNMQQLQNGQLFWMDRFTTEHLEEATQ